VVRDMGERREAGGGRLKEDVCVTAVTNAGT
jgi:hypothetical protein